MHILLSESIGKIHLFSWKYPAAIGELLNKIKAVATINLSATGSKNAPKLEKLP